MFKIPLRTTFLEAHKNSRGNALRAANTKAHFDEELRNGKDDKESFDIQFQCAH